MGYTCFEIDESEGVAHVRLCRPDEFNTMIPEFWRELPEIIGELSDSGRARVVVLSSTGKHFCAGMDLAVFTGGSAAGSSDAITEVGRQRAALRYNILHLQNALTSLERARMPVLVAIQGGCVGGAVDMVTAADCRYASADAWFCIQEINIGMTADVGTLQRLPKLIPEGVARELAYTGRRMGAQRAASLGLVNEVFDDHETCFRGFTRSPRRSLRSQAIHGTKEAINYSRDHSVADSLSYIAAWQTGMFQPDDTMECFLAKTEGREPK